MRWLPPPPLRRVFWAILALGLVARLLLAGEMLALGTGRDANAPLDPWMYTTEARMILDGDLTLSGVPDLFEGTTGVAGYLASAEGRARFLRRNGERPLVDAPAYPYLVAASLGLTGSTAALRVAQVLATLLIAWLTYLLAVQAQLSQRAALIAMLCVGLHSTTALYAAFVLKTTVITILFLLIALGLATYVRRPSGRAALALGAALGALHLTKGVLILLLPFVALGFVLAPVEGLRARARHGGLLVVGFLLLTWPLIVRSQVCGTSPLHNGGSLYLIAVCNFVGADGLHLVQPPLDYVLERIRGRESSLSVLGAAIETHPDPSSFARLLLTKFVGFWSGYEAWNNLEPARDRYLFSSLRAFPLTTWPLLALALIGLPAGLRRWRALFAVWALLALVLGSCLIAFTLARYRLPAVPFLAILAALGVERLVRWRHHPGWLASGAVLAFGLTWPGTIAVVARPDAPPILPWRTEHDATLRLVGIYEGRNPELTMRLLVRAAQTHPLVADGAPPERVSRRRLAEALALHARAYRACVSAGDAERAADLLASVDRLDPSGRARALLTKPG